MMEAIRKIGFGAYDCMCWEEDEFGQRLQCSPFECEISYCPIKQLITIIQGLSEKASAEE